MPDNPRFKHWATVYTDASWSSPERSGWAARVRYDEAPLRVEGSGSCPLGTADSGIAELHAIVMGIDLALETWQSIRGLWVRSDCQPAIRWAQPPFRGAKRKDVLALQRQLLKLITSRSPAVRLDVKWVKGHNGTATQQGWLNNRVDALARSARPEARP